MQLFKCSYIFECSELVHGLFHIQPDQPNRPRPEKLEGRDKSHANPACI